MSEPSTPGQIAVTVKLATEAERPAVGRLLELYQHDLSDIWDQDLDEQGEYGYPLDRFWRERGCHAFVIRAGGRLAGVALVDGSVKRPGNHLWMAQFFVVRKYRRQGVGARAAAAVFDELRGKWEVGQMTANTPAQAFWRRVIGAYTDGRYEEHLLTTGWWQGSLQTFDNTPRTV